MWNDNQKHIMNTRQVIAYGLNYEVAELMINLISKAFNQSIVAYWWQDTEYRIEPATNLSDIELGNMIIYAEGIKDCYMVIASKG